MERLERLISEADFIGVNASSVRCEAAKQVHHQDPILAVMLNDLFPDIADQANWLFSPLFGRTERPIDLIVSQRHEEVAKVVAALLYGIGL